MKRLLLLLVFVSCAKLQAQQLTMVGGYGLGLMENNYTAFDPSALWLGRVSYSNGLGLFGLRYNVGLEYGADTWGNRPMAQIGLSAVFLRPSGFIRAATAEDVSYNKTKWYLSVDINSYHGVSGLSDTLVYQWAIEPSLVLGRPLNRYWLIIGAFSLRHSRIPAYTENHPIYATSNFVGHLGLSWRIHSLAHKP
jgi:hypothetical protein